MAKIKSTKTSDSFSVTMADLLAKHPSSIVGFSRGQRIEAKLTEITNKSAIFDVGGKSEGVLNDLYFQEAKDYVRNLKIGDKVPATVIDPETSDGSVLLSLRHAANDSMWEGLEKAYEKELDIPVMVRNITNSGIVVEHGSVSGFIPLSQIGKKTAAELSDLIDKQIKVKVIDVDRERRKVVFSEKYVSEAEDVALKKQALKSIKEGEIYSGLVTTVAEFGAFVSLPIVDEVTDQTVTIEGLIHLSELSWDKVASPTEVVNEGQEVKVKVIGLRDGKLALSLKQAQEDPWKTIGEKYHADDKVTGHVIRMSDFGAFVALEPGVEGLVHITKIPPATKLKTGDEVKCYIEEIDTESKKISLGLVLTSKPVAYK